MADSQNIGSYTDKFYYVDFEGMNKCAKDCDPVEGLPCMGHPPESSPQLFDTSSSCCTETLWWIDVGQCITDTNGGSNVTGGGGLVQPSNKYFVDYQTGSCLQDCEPGPFGCALVPPPIVLYDTIEVCCAIGQWWVDFDYCTSRSIDDYSDGWIVDYTNQKCCES